MMNALNAMLCWTPDTDHVALVPWPDAAHASDAYQMTGLACYSHVRAQDFEGRKAIVFIEAMHLIIRDRCDPMAVHKALCGLEEYQAGLADDVPGVRHDLRDSEE